MKAGSVAHLRQRFDQERTRHLRNWKVANPEAEPPRATTIAEEVAAGKVQVLSEALQEALDNEHGVEVHEIILTPTLAAYQEGREGRDERLERFERALEMATRSLLDHALLTAGDPLATLHRFMAMSLEELEGFSE